MRIGLVACVKSKRAVPSAAKDLYVSPLFRGGRSAVEASCDRWYILSAAHGPEQVIEPYEVTLNGASRRAKRSWSARVLHELESAIDASVTFEIHAGADYHAWGLSDGLRARGAKVVLPTEGLMLGEKLAHYAARSPTPASGGGEAGPRSSRRERRPIEEVVPVPPPTGRYRPLFEYLVASTTDRWDATFDDIEATLGRRLPASARRHNAWWSNTREGHSHARAWLAAGWRTSHARPEQGTVTFERRDG